MKSIIILFIINYTLAQFYQPPFETEAFTLKGSTFIEGNYIKLTNDKQNQTGILTINKRILSDTFNVTYTFTLLSKENKYDFGEGIAFWLTPGQIEPGEALGGPTRWKGLAIFIDQHNDIETKSDPIQIVYNNGDLQYDKKTDGIGIMQRSCDIKLDRNKQQHLSIVYKQGIFKIYINNEYCSQLKQQTKKGLLISASAMTSTITDVHVIKGVFVQDLIDRKEHETEQYFTKVNIDAITRKFTALELGRESEYNLKVLFQALKEADESTAITKKFAEERKAKLGEILNALNDMPNGLSTRQLNDYLRVMNVELGNLYDVYDNIIKTSQNLTERLRENTILHDHMVVNKLSLFELILCLNGIVLAGASIYLVVKSIKNRRSYF